MTETVRFTLNGESCAIDAPADANLLHLLREKRALMAAKPGCGIGRCGACMVLVDGAPANACLVLAFQLEGTEVITPEGLDLLPIILPIRAALAEENAFQCGYCAPGFTVSLAALFARDPDADEPAIRAALERNICRCTGYHSIIRGALAAAAKLREARSQ
mgnify:CR=1 FL=1